MYSPESENSEVSASNWLSGGMNGLDIMKFQRFVNLIKRYKKNALEEKETKMKNLLLLLNKKQKV